MHCTLGVKMQIAAHIPGDKSDPSPHFFSSDIKWDEPLLLRVDVELTEWESVKISNWWLETLMPQWWWSILPPLCQCRTRDLIQGSVSARNGIPRNLVTPNWHLSREGEEINIIFLWFSFFLLIFTFVNSVGINMWRYLHFFTHLSISKYKWQSAIWQSGQFNKMMMQTAKS